MQGIILAAGMGKRLKDLTRNNTKCMIKVNGVTIIERMLRQLEKLNLSKIVIVIGYEGKKLIDYIGTLNIRTPICYVNNPIYDKTNNIYSLSLAKEYLIQEDTILLESDLVFEDSILDMLLNDPRETLALVDKYESWMDGTCIKLGENDTIIDFIPKKKFDFKEIDKYYKTVNIYKFSKHFSETYYIPFLNAYAKALGMNEYYEQVLRVIIMLDAKEIMAKKLDGQLWYEIDDIQDLDIAESMFVEDENERVSLLQGRYGGYWRYPKLIDFCYLVNPYYPPKKMVEEIKAAFETLLTEYPSGMKVNSLLAAKNFGVKQEYILAGNGAAELIKSLLGTFDGKLGIISPTFEEYAHRYDHDSIVRFWPDNDNYEYNESDLIEFFGKNKVDNIILINPDNPSGNYIPKEGLLKLINWTKSQNINLVIDESFSDFADETDNSLFINELLEENPHLFVMKSISKSYGVPGLRLGVLASGNTEVIGFMKKDVAIWNINSFAEFYMQISEKYFSDYVEALKKFREERTRFSKKLSEIRNIRVIPSQANYIMAEITNGMTSEELTRILIIKHNILIKNLYPKLNDTEKQLIRIAVRTAEDDDKLIFALRSVLESEET